jgi:hypothetical protein
MAAGIIAHYRKWKGENIIQLTEKYSLEQANFDYNF